MRSANPKTPNAKRCVMQLFQDRYGRAKRKPYYLNQIQTLFESKFSDDVIHYAVKQLVRDNALSIISANTKNEKKIMFLYNSKFANPEFKSLRDTHIKSTCRLIDKYSDPDISKQYGDHLENLVKAELQRQGFTIVDSHKKKYKNKVYDKNESNLDFIAEHHSGKLTIGVEVKNTLSVLDKKEVDTKLDMCNCLGITPVFAVRWIKPYIKHIEDRGGFPWIFKNQLYPPDMEKLAIKLNQRLHLPVNTATELPPESIQPFHNWVKNKTAQSRMET